MSGSKIDRSRQLVCHTCRLQGFRQLLPLEQYRRSITKGQNIAVSKNDPALAQRIKFVNLRITELGGEVKTSEAFPRWQRRERAPLLSAAEFAKTETGPIGDVTNNGEDLITVYEGRFKNKRRQSGQLRFLDLESGGYTAQTMLETASLKAADPEVGPDVVKDYSNGIRKGDWIAATGQKFLDKTGRPTLRVLSKPVLLAPSLQPPTDSVNPEFLSRNRHVDRLIHPAGNDVLRLRHSIVQGLRSWLIDRGFIEVNTPILAGSADGATARPFQTYATEFSHIPLQLRVAPELYLKRLVVGGLDKVFEIGMAFRNEGVDFTHNPEFQICEFYEAMADLPKLIKDTEGLLHLLATATNKQPTSLTAQMETNGTLEKVKPERFQGPYKQIDFIPAIETAVQVQLSDPDWLFPDIAQTSTTFASAYLLKTLNALGVEPPATPTLPRILDLLASKLLEPQCCKPTWITHHPECMSPLAKSFTKAHSTSGQSHTVSARAELFIDGREYVNCYEEENNPLEQRRKFHEQLEMRKMSDEEDTLNGEPEETGAIVDENYIGALEWGLPPTGGWGCGIDRLVMLFAGQSRIADVLPFGTLTNVVALSAEMRNAAAKAAKKDTALGEEKLQ